MYLFNSTTLVVGEESILQTVCPNQCDNLISPPPPPPPVGGQISICFVTLIVAVFLYMYVVYITVFVAIHFFWIWILNLKSYISHRHFPPLQWRDNEHDGVSNRQPHDCLLNGLFRRRSKKISKLRVTGLCAGNSPVAGEFPAQRASNAESVSI